MAITITIDSITTSMTTIIRGQRSPPCQLIPISINIHIIYIYIYIINITISIYIYIYIYIYVYVLVFLYYIIIHIHIKWVTGSVVWITRAPSSRRRARTRLLPLLKGY